VIIYRPIPGFPDYRVGDDGSVWSQKTGNHHWKRLRPAVRLGGRLQVILRKDGASHSRLVHHLVLEAFIGPRPPGMECAHWDGDAGNCRLSNLRWATHTDNERDKFRHGTDSRGERNARAKLTWEQVREIRTRYATGDETQEKLAREFDVSFQLISLIVKRGIWIEVA